MDGRHTGPGSRQLAQLIDIHGDHLAADLLEVYGVDVRDVVRANSSLTPRWVWVLIKGLPDTSRYVCELRGGPQFRGWDAGTYVQAATVNAIRGLQHTYVTANSKRRPPLPDPFPIPDADVQKKKKRGGFADMVSQLQAQQKGVTGG